MVSEADGEAEERDDTRELTASSPTCTSVKSTTTRRATASMIYQGTAGTDHRQSPIGSGPYQDFQSDM